MIDYYKQPKDQGIHLSEFKELVGNGINDLERLNHFLNSIARNSECSIDQKKKAKEFSEFISSRIEKERKLLN